MAMNNTSTAGAPNLNQGAVIQEAPLGAGVGLVATWGAALGSGLDATGAGGAVGGCGGGVAGSGGDARGGLGGRGAADAPGFPKMAVAAPVSELADTPRAAAGG